MADIYVDDDGSDTSPYNTWAKAANSIETISPAAGDTVYVADTHQETKGTGSLTIDLSSGTRANPIKVLSAEVAGTTLSTMESAGGFISSEVAGGGVADMIVNGSAYLWGLTLRWARNGSIANQATAQTYEQCYFEKSISRTGSFSMGNSGSDGTLLAWIDCTVDYSVYTFAGQDMFTTGRATNFLVKNLTFIPPTTPGDIDYFMQGSSAGSTRQIIVEDSDLTDFTNFQAGGTASGGGPIGSIVVRRCKIPALPWGEAAASTNEDSTLLIENCEDGTIAAPTIGLNELWSFWGVITGVTAQFRTDGASDGENDYSWEMVSYSNTIELLAALESPAITRWVDGGSEITVTVYIAGAADLDDDEFWIEINSPNETASPNQTAQGNFYTSKPAILDTPTALPRSSGTTWDGSGTGVDGSTGQQKLSRTFTPTEAGPITVRCFLAKPSTTVYVDPRIDGLATDGIEHFSNAGQINEIGGAGGTASVLGGGALTGGFS